MTDAETVTGTTDGSGVAGEFPDTTTGYISPEEWEARHTDPNHPLYSGPQPEAILNLLDDPCIQRKVAQIVIRKMRVLLLEMENDA